MWESDAECGGCLEAKRALFSDKASVRELPIDLKAGTVQISERLRVPLEPMIGTIATASVDENAASTFMPTYKNGGNMDLRQLGKGASIVLPVLAEGGLLYVGDLHAAMGHGEPTWVGFESAGTVVMRVSLVKGKQFPYPRLYIGDRTLFTSVCARHPIGADQPNIQYMSNIPHDTATQDALSQAYDYLVEDEGLTPEEAHGFLTAKADAFFGGPASAQAIISLPDVKKYLI